MTAPLFFMTVNADETRRWANRPIAADFFYEGRILQTGSIIRNISDKDGNWVRSRVSGQFADGDKLFRTLLDVDDYEYLMNREAMYFIQSLESMHAGELPVHVMTAVIREPQVGERMTASIQADDWIGSVLSPFNPDRKFPFRTLSRGMFKDLPDDLVGAVQQIIVGIMSDVGHKNDKGEAADQGKLKFRYVGQKMITDDGSEAPPGMVPRYLKPPVLTVTVTGSGPSFEAQCAATFRTANGETSGSNVVTVLNYPLNPSTSHYATWEWVNSEPEFDSQITGSGVYGFRPGQDNGWHMLDRAGFVADSSPRMGRYVHNGQPIGDDNFGKQFYGGPPATSTAQVGQQPGGSSGPTVMEWGVLFGCGHAINPDYVIGYYWPEQVEDEIVNVPIPEGAFGSEVLAPGKPGWPHPTPYVDIPDEETGKVHRCTVIYARGDRLEMHKNGQGYFGWNTSGFEDVGDGTGEPIRRAAFAQQHILSEFIAANNGEGYHTGLWSGVPFFAIDPDLPMIDTDSIQETQAKTVEWIGGIGYVMDHCIEDETTIGTWIADVNRWFNFKCGTNERGSFFLKVLNDTASPTEGNVYRQGIEIGRLLAPEIAYPELENQFFVSYEWHPARGEFMQKNQRFFDQPSFDQYKEWFTVNLDMKGVADPTTLNDVVGRRLMLNKWRPLYQRFLTDLVASRDDLLNPILITHKQGLGANGYVDRPFAITQMELIPHRSTYIVRARDMRRVLAAAGNGGSLADETDPEYAGFVLGDENSTELPPVGAVELR